MRVMETTRALNNLYTALEINTDPICLSRGETTEAMRDYLRIYCPKGVNKGIFLTGRVLLAMSRINDPTCIGNE